MSNAYYGERLIRRWASGVAAAIPAPLAVRSRWYRRLVVELFDRIQPVGSRTILSLGSGTGHMERALAARGFDVVASDIAPDALALCREAGLTTVRCDILAPPPGLRRFDCLYADGLLGHFPDPDDLRQVWRRTHEHCRDHFILSNDLADDDRQSNYAVHANPAARFFRPPAGTFARSALRTGLWSGIWSRILVYHRPGRGLRRRELLILRAVTDGRTDGRAAR